MKLEHSGKNHPKIEITENKVEHNHLLKEKYK